MPWHPERPERLLAIERALDRHGWLGWERREAPLASEAELELVHSAEHVVAIRELCARGGGAIDPDTYAVEASWQAARRAAGGACAMVRALLAGEDSVGFCAGTRPATMPNASGRWASASSTTSRWRRSWRSASSGSSGCFVVDWDVHHGNGTAEIFRRRDDVLVANIHQSGIYPGIGAARATSARDRARDSRSTCPSPPAPARTSGSRCWSTSCCRRAGPSNRSWSSISAGFDAHRADPLAGCELEATSFAQMSCHVRDFAAELGVPLGAVLEGGYEVEALAECVRVTLAALGGEGETIMAAPEALLTSRAAAQIGHYWEL